MSQQESINLLVNSLTELDTYLTELCKILLQEQTALVDKQMDSIEKLAEQKTNLTQQIENVEQRRVSICADLNIQPDKKSLGLWLKTQPKAIQQQIAKRWKRITYLGQKCTTQNQINGIMVVHQQRFTQDAISILRGTVSGQDEYSENGMQENKSSHNIIGKV